MGIKSIAVFCGSKSGNNPIFETHTRELGEILANKNICIIYGAGNRGLMGAVANASLKNGGLVMGVIPTLLKDQEHMHIELSETHVVADMHTRKKMIFEKSDAAIILPGGYGTLDELFEALTLIQTRKIRNFPVVLFGSQYWRGLLSWLTSTMLNEKNINSEDLSLMHLTDSPKDAVDFIIKTCARK